MGGAVCAPKTATQKKKVLKEIIRDDFRLATAVNAHLSSPVANHLGIKKTEIISILKRRHNSMENVGLGIAGGDLKLHNISSLNGAGSSSINSTTLSDGSLQKFDDDDDESDSDWDGFPVSDKKKEKPNTYVHFRQWCTHCALLQIRVLPMCTYDETIVMYDDSLRDNSIHFHFYSVSSIIIIKTTTK